MTSPQDIREKTFEKAVFGGYEMGAVDDYMDSLAAELGAIQKENSALKAKMKVLVDKIEEYRTNESALNMAILSAQKLSVQIESDARSRAAAIVSEAEAKAAATIGSIDERIAQEEDRLQKAKLSSAKFFETMKELCQKQLANLDSISAASRSVKYDAAPADARIQNESNSAKAEADQPDNGNTQVFLSLIHI